MNVPGAHARDLITALMARGIVTTGHAPLTHDRDWWLVGDVHVPRLGPDQLYLTVRLGGRARVDEVCGCGVHAYGHSSIGCLTGRGSAYIADCARVERVLDGRVVAYGHHVIQCVGAAGHVRVADGGHVVVESLCGRLDVRRHSVARVMVAQPGATICLNGTSVIIDRIADGGHLCHENGSAVIERDESTGRWRVAGRWGVVRIDVPRRLNGGTP